MVGTPCISSCVILPVPKSIPRKTCLESAEMTSPFAFFGKLYRIVRFPHAVGPQMMQILVSTWLNNTQDLLP